MSNSEQKLVLARLLVATARVIHSLEVREDIFNDGEEVDNVMRVTFNLIDCGLDDDEIAVWLTNYKASLGGVPVEQLRGAGAADVVAFSEELLARSREKNDAG